MTTAREKGVLAVMDTEIRRAGGEAYQAGRDLIEARATVAELIAALEETTVELASIRNRKLTPGEQHAVDLGRRALARANGESP